METHGDPLPRRFATAKHHGRSARTHITEHFCAALTMRFAAAGCKTPQQERTHAADHVFQNRMSTPKRKNHTFEAFLIQNFKKMEKPPKSGNLSVETHCDPPPKRFAAARCKTPRQERTHTHHGLLLRSPDNTFYSSRDAKHHGWCERRQVLREVNS